MDRQIQLLVAILVLALTSALPTKTNGDAEASAGVKTGAVIVDEPAASKGKAYDRLIAPPSLVKRPPYTGGSARTRPPKGDMVESYPGPHPYPHPFPRPSPIDTGADDYNFTFVNTTDAFGDLGQAESVDLLFLVDVTGSMGSYIHGVKESIIGIVNLLTNDTDGEALVKNLRLSFVGYRDFSDDPNFETLPFTKDGELFLEFVKSVGASGGGDTPEDVYGGLDRALRQDWQSDVRVMLHIADAPCHGVKCGNSDSDPETSPQRKTPEELFKEIDAKDVRYNFGVITGLTKQMVKYFKEIAVKDFALFDLRVEEGSYFGGGGYGAGASGDLVDVSEAEYRRIGTKDRYGYKVGSAAFGSVVNAIKGSG